MLLIETIITIVIFILAYLLIKARKTFCSIVIALKAIARLVY